MKTLFSLLLLIFGSQLSSQYCIPQYNPDPGVHIHNFNLGDILNRNSFYAEDLPYTFYQDITTDLEIGRTYPMTASGDVNAGIKGDWAIWIDFNNDEEFSNDEKIWAELDVRSTGGLITFPNDPSIEGQKRMRISYVWTPEELDPCGEYNNGETEDYIVNFVKGPIEAKYYCMPYDALDSDAFYINDFVLGGLENYNSGNNEFNFSDYNEEDFDSDFVIGETYNYTLVKAGQANIEGGFTAWVDFDDDQIFQEDEIIFEDGPNIVATEGTLTFDYDESFLGLKKMRVRAVRSPDFPMDACGFDDNTETEDYMINFVLPTFNKETSVKSSFSVFPNPCDDVLKIVCQDSKTFEYSIYDIYGQVIEHRTVIGASNSNINTSTLLSGMYIIDVFQNEKSQKIIFIKR